MIRGGLCVIATAVLCLGAYALAGKKKPVSFILPGWSDLSIGKAPPKDMQLTCVNSGFKNSGISHCKACRSQKLPFPCLSIGTDDGGRVSFIGVDMQLAEADEVVKSLVKQWEVYTGRTNLQTSLMEDGLCWMRGTQVAYLARRNADGHWVLMISGRKPGSVICQSFD